MSAAGATPPSDLRIWLADLEALSPALEASDARYGLLSPSERSWPVHSPPENRRLRRLARIALRAVLARAGASQALGVEFDADANGKPALPGSALAFNASHAGTYALFALSALGPVGIDLEGRRTVALSERRRVMIEAAAAGLTRGDRAPPSAPNLDFLQAWTCLEAFGKARGTGIGALLTELGITASGARVHTDADVAARASTIIAASDLEVVPLRMAPNFYAAVAAPRPISPAGLTVHTLDAAHLDLAEPGITAI